MHNNRLKSNRSRLLLLPSLMLGTLFMSMESSYLNAQPDESQGKQNAVILEKSLVDAKTHQLENGLKIVILPCGKAPIVTVGMLVHVGTADDPVDEVGLSHFLEHMMFKGTTKVPSDQFKKQILRIGGQTNAMTEYDYTLYYTTVAADKFVNILELEADRLRHLSFSKKEVESEKKVVLEERGMRIDNNPMGTAYERLLQAFNPYHPYGVLPIGFPHHIKKYSYESARAHYNKWYHPNNVTLIISGNITLEKALPLIKKNFGNIPAGEIATRARTPNPEREGITQELSQINKRNSLIIGMWMYDAPHFHGVQNKKEYYALGLLSQILGGNSMTDYSQAIVDQKKLAIDVTSEYDGGSIDAKYFSLSAVLNPAMDIKTTEAEMQKQIKEIIDKGVSDDVLSRAKNDLLSPLDSLKDGTENYLFTVANHLGKNHHIEMFNNYVENIQILSSQDIQEVAKKVLGRDAVVKIVIYPVPVAPHSKENEQNKKEDGEDKK